MSDADSLFGAGGFNFSPKPETPTRPKTSMLAEPNHPNVSNELFAKTKSMSLSMAKSRDSNPLPPKTPPHSARTKKQPKEVDIKVPLSARSANDEKFPSLN